MKETWKDVPGYEGLYQVSTLGQVKRLETIIKVRFKTKEAERIQPEKILVQYTREDHYPTVTLSKENKQWNISVHRLVSLTFLPNPENKKYINHKNGIKTDNRLENLEWCTASENAQHARDTGLKIPTWGEDNNSTLKQTQVVEIFDRLKKGENPKDLGLEYGVHEVTIRDIRDGRSWRNVTGLEGHKCNKHWTVDKYVKGSDSYFAKLTEENVLEIVKLLKEGNLTQTKIAEKFDIKQVTVSDIKTGKSWSHLTGIKK